MRRQGVVDGMPGWEYVRLIGSGSFGEVYEVKKIGYENVPHSALKIITIPRDSSERNAIHYLNEDGTRKYFESYKNEVVSEIEMMARFKGHSHIISLEDYTEIEHTDEIGWDILMRMELLETVDKAIDHKTFTEEELSEFVIKMGMDVCEALMLCHEKNIIHRDVKPANIFINKNGDFKLGDFGIARTMERTLSLMSQKGSPAFMAPEVFNGKVYDQSCDIYSLGMTLYRYLNNYRLPFEPMEDLRPSDVEKAQTRRLRGERIEEPLHGTARLKEVVLKAVEFKPDNRYHTAEEFYEALKECKKTGLDTPPPPSPFPYKLLFSVLIALIVALTLAIVVIISMDRKAVSNSDLVHVESDNIIIENLESQASDPSVILEEPDTILENEDNVIKFSDMHLVEDSWSGRKGKVLSGENKARCRSEDIYPVPGKTEYEVVFENLSKDDIGFLDDYLFGYLVYNENSAMTHDLFYKNYQAFSDYINSSGINLNNTFVNDTEGDFYIVFNISRVDKDDLDKEEVKTLEAIVQKGLCLKKIAQETKGDIIVNTDWHLNTLKKEYGALGDLGENGDLAEAKKYAFGVEGWKRTDIKSIHFLDTLEDMPSDAVDISSRKDGRVMGWLDKDKNLYIAGNGGVMANNDSSALFAWYTNVKEIDFGGNFHTDIVKKMKYMFYHCYKLETLDLSGFDTSRVETMAKMFVECRKLKDVDLSSFSTENVSSFYAMFNKCNKLVKLDLSTFSTTEAETFEMMFYNCEKLEKIQVNSSLFTTGKVKNMRSMFSHCLSLEEMDFSGFDMEKVKNSKGMFVKCPYMDKYGIDGEYL